MTATVKGFTWFVCANKIAFYRLFELTNRMWFSVVYTLIDNDIRHHSGQNVVDSRRAKSLFQSVTKIMTQRKSKRCL